MVLSTKINPGGLGGHGNKAECARVTWGGQHGGSCAPHLNLFHHTAEMPGYSRGQRTWTASREGPESTGSCEGGTSEFV